MIKAGKAWSWLVAKVKGSESSKSSGPPLREVPPIPAPKVRSKARYSLVVIGETGRSRQIELTPWRIRVAAGVTICVAVLVTVSVVKGFWGRSVNTDKIVQDQALEEKVRSLQEELKQKEVALSVQEKRLKELQEPPTLAVGQQTPSLDSASPLAKTEKPKESEGPLVALQESGTREFGVPATARKPGDSRSEVEAESIPPKSPEPENTESKGPIINFNAQRVTAIADRSNSGTLSFQLVKDQPDIRFSGYLFVFVEMGDGQESKIYAYPKRARLGEGDLPSDFREGESVSFKYNSRVELPYGDTRSSATLSRVSILLYGQDGRIVFQRGFDRKEVKTLSAKNHGPSGAGKNRGTEKRRAL